MCREAGVILGITKELAEDARSGKHVLEYAFFIFFNIWRQSVALCTGLLLGRHMLRKIVNWKRLNPEVGL
jgi:hypothetical protein